MPVGLSVESECSKNVTANVAILNDITIRNNFYRILYLVSMGLITTSIIARNASKFIDFVVV